MRPITPLVRAITEQDLDGLMLLALQTGGGMTTLKPDRALLSERVAIACASFAETIAPARRDYLFVMDDITSGRLVGVCAIKSAVGLDEPFYNYRLGTLVHSSRELDVFSKMETLYLSNDLTGSAELCSLFLHPDYRIGSNGKLLSKSRFLFMAQFPHLFPERLIAEMRGFQREDGTSPFWDSLGAHFFKMDFDRADALSSPGKKAFIAELMPRHPLYVDYLTASARDVIGMVHVATAPARHLLEQEGLHYEGYVDIFDAGPVLQGRTSELRALRESTRAVVAPFGMAASAGKPVLISTTDLRDFRCIATCAQVRHGQVALTPDDQRLLKCRDGSQVRTMALDSRKNPHA
ncbi:MAG: arginine N-succinyltransferase [Herminiimonas sp.]|nr:arginine N-succinyltransferase [Herminiimonas sp.]